MRFKEFHSNKNQGVAESISEDVGGNYLYHSTEDAETAKAILRSGVFKAGNSAQDATDAQIGNVKSISFGRNIGYQMSGSNVRRDYQVVFVIDRNALETRYKTIGTSQSGDVRGLARGLGINADKLQNQNPSLRKQLKGRYTLNRRMVDTNKDNVVSKDEIKANPDLYLKYFQSKAGNEFEEVVPVKSGVLPWKGILVGFYLVPGKAASKDPELLNNPLRLDMPRPNTFVRAKQQGVAENLNEFSLGNFGDDNDDRNDLQLYLNVALKLKMKKLKPETMRAMITRKMAELVNVVDPDKVDWAYQMLRKEQGLSNMLDQQGVAEGEKEALQFATQAHSGQTRAGGDPYISHPQRVADHIKQYKKSHNLDALISAAYLHDTLEDTDTTHEALHDLFGGLVASLVKELTSDPEKIKQMGKAKYLSHKMATMSSYALVIKLADRLDNVRDITTAKTPEWRQKYKNETEQILDYIEKNRVLSGTHKKLIGLIRDKLGDIDKDKEGVAEATGDEEFDTMLSKITSPTAVNAQNREDTVNELIRTYFWHKRRADLGPEKTHEHGHEKIVLKILKKLNRMGIDLAKVDPVKLKMIKSQVYEQGVTESNNDKVLSEKAKSKAQQRFFGMAHALQKGKKIPGASTELKQVAKSMGKKDVKDFAKTKHKNLPTHVKKG